MWSKIREYIIRRLIDMGGSELELKDFDNSDDVKRWVDIYKNEPHWIKKDMYGNEIVGSRNLGATIASELARKTTIELTSSITGGNKAEFMNEPYQDLVGRSREITEQLLVQGGGVLKPFKSESGSLAIEYLTYDNFIPVRFNDVGDLVGVTFIHTINKGKLKYTKLETHDYRPNGDYLIESKAYLENGNGNSVEVNLSEVDEWAKIKQREELSDISRPFYVYMKTPFSNNKEFGSNIGVSVFSKIEELIMDYDVLYSLMMWEYQGSQLEVFADNQLFHGLEDGAGSKKSEGLDKSKMRRLFRRFDKKGVDGELMTTFNPNIRDENYSHGLDIVLKKIEDAVGLARGDLSEQTFTAKTATEVTASQQRAHSTTKDIQKKIKQAYLDVVEIMGEIISHYKMIDEYKEDIEASINFDDSIVFDKKGEIELMMLELDKGLISKEHYLMKRYGLTEEQALDRLPSKQ